MRNIKTFEDFNPAIKKEVEDYVDELIEKDYNELLKILNIKTPGREIDVDELKQQAIEYFMDAPDRMNQNNLSFKSVPVKTNVIPKLTNIGGYLRESSDKNYIKMMIVDLTEDYQYEVRVISSYGTVYIDILSPRKWNVPNINWEIVKSKIEQILDQLDYKYKIDEIGVDIVGGALRRRFKELDGVKLGDEEEINGVYIILEDRVKTSDDFDI